MTRLPVRAFLLAFLILLAALTMTPPAVQARQSAAGLDGFYGINFVAPSEPWLTLAKGTGAGVVRWQFNWRDHEPSPGQWLWEYSDGSINAWNRAGIKVDAILHNPPDWALVGTGLVPRNINLTWNHPDNAWGRFCNEFARRYRGKIDSYEIWNEPDLEQYWEGTAQEYFYLMKSCYMGIKAADPGVTVAMAGIVHIVDQGFLPTVLQMATSDPGGPANNYYFDVANVHMYVNPEFVYSVTTSVRATLSQYGLGYKPIWITETNIPASPGSGRQRTVNNWEAVPDEETGWYILQAVSNAHAAGASRFMIFRLADDGMSELFGLVRSDRTKRASYDAYRLATSLMHDIVSAEREVQGDIVINTLNRADGARIIVIYSRQGVSQPVSIPAGLEEAVVISAAGGFTAIRADGRGEYALNLLPARTRNSGGLERYAVGGPPLVIYEFDSAAPTVLVEALPTDDYGSQMVVRWRGLDGAIGTGIDHYDVEVRRDGGEWEAWDLETESTQTAIDLSDGSTYEFRVRAVDVAGNAGEFAETGPLLFRPSGRLIVRVLDLRGQAVPFARLKLGDGTLYDADGSGWLQLDLPVGQTTLVDVDGSIQGHLPLDRTINLIQGQEFPAVWTLYPRNNLIAGGDFSDGLGLWRGTSPADAGPLDGGMLIGGRRHPWGAPSATLTVDVPPGMPDAYLSFTYRLPEGSILHVGAVGQTATLHWRIDQPTPILTRYGVEMGRLSGERVTLIFSVAGPKGGPLGAVLIDDLALGAVPIIPPGS